MKKWKEWLNKPADNGTSTKTMNAIVEEIHDMFNTASDRAVTVAQEIMASKAPVRSDAEALRALGFRQAAPVVLAEKEHSRTKMAQEESDIVMYYQQRYPGYKFILEKQVQEICKKYNLVCGAVARYKGDVPSKNVQEITQFNMCNPIHPEDRTYVRTYPNSISGPSTSSYEEYQRYIQKIEDRQKGAEEISIHMWHLSMYESIVTENKSYNICAPLKDMDMSKAQLQGYKVMDIPDPVVLYPVRGGAIVVSKWGIEAEDETVINQKMN